MILFTKEKILACPRPRATKNGVVFMPKNYKELKKKLSAEFFDNWDGGPISGPIGVSISIMTPTKRTGDIDNYAKTILDALEDSAIFYDDIQICHMSVKHHLGDSYLTSIEISLRPDEDVTHYSDKVTAKKEKIKKEEPTGMDPAGLSAEDKRALIDSMLGGGS